MDGNVTKVILSLGSNRGDREAWLAFARSRLTFFPHTELLLASPIHQTDPVDVPEEYRDCLYLNQVIQVSTTLPSRAFSDFVHAIEQEAGRKRGRVRNTPRTLDIDIIAFGDLQQNDPELILPHPRGKERRFVLEPLSEILPDYRFPGAPNQSLAELLKSAK